MNRLPTHAYEVGALTFEVTDNLEVMTYFLWCIRATEVERVLSK